MCCMICICGSVDGTNWERLESGEGSQRMRLACVLFWDLEQAQASTTSPSKSR